MTIAEAVIGNGYALGRGVNEDPGGVPRMGWMTNRGPRKGGRNSSHVCLNYKTYANAKN